MIPRQFSPLTSRRPGQAPDMACALFSLRWTQYWAKKSSWIEDVRCGGGTETVIQEVGRAIRSAGLHMGPVGIINLRTAMPHRDFELLAKELPHLRQ